MTYLKIPHDKRFCWCAFVERDLYANNFSVKHLALNQEEDCIWLQDCKLRLSQSWTWSLDQLSCLRFSMAHIDWPESAPHRSPYWCWCTHEPSNFLWHLWCQPGSNLCGREANTELLKSSLFVLCDRWVLSQVASFSILTLISPP